MHSSSITYPALSSAMMSSAEVTQSANLTADDNCKRDTILLKGAKSENLVSVGKTLQKKENKSVSSSNVADNGFKPPGLSYIALISMAIQSSHTKRMMLSEIYQWISERYPYYQLKDKSWRNSIRHNLSLNECFVKCGRSENGKGNYWSIHPANIVDFAKGDYRRRRARRRVRMCDDDLQRLCAETPEPEKPTLPETRSGATNVGYVPMISTMVPSNFLSILGVEPTRSCDYWMTSPYYHGDSPYTSYRPQIHLGSSSCTSEKCCYSGCTDPSCRESQEPYVHVFGRGNDSDTVPAVSSPESSFSVNVNVNVLGSRGLPALQSQYDQTYSGHQRVWNDSHL